ncbi:MAG: hypothetical protein RR944_03395, partial [Acinetobacter sp.]|uniref:hypothetical protein n=1 Tax=Acinetobacter sp. TaxID=472 RepID=UPI002FCC4C20
GRLCYSLSKESQLVLLIISKLIQGFQISPLGLNPCFSTSFNQHHRRWMCILQHFRWVATLIPNKYFRVLIFQTIKYLNN